VVGQEGPKRIDGIYSAVFARPDWVDKNPQTTNAILQTFIQAAEWTSANPEAAAEIIGQEINIPTDLVLTILKPGFPG
jgi:ABC-type nitrate/sulfonate/bicarbonate transport system substrate-binding protein